MLLTCPKRTNKSTFGTAFHAEEIVEKLIYEKGEQNPFNMKGANFTVEK